MSKIGRKPIDLGSVQVNVEGSDIHFKGQKISGTYSLPSILKATVADKQLTLSAVEESDDLWRLWGLHRALLANQIIGAGQGFERKLKIVGLGFKAVASGNKVQFTIGYSHKVDFELPAGISIEIDKTGQLLTLRDSNKEQLGLVASKIRNLRLPEPYKGTGIQYLNEVIRRKAGKAKS